MNDLADMQSVSVGNKFNFCDNTSRLSVFQKQINVFYVWNMTPLPFPFIFMKDRMNNDPFWSLICFHICRLGSEIQTCHVHVQNCILFSLKTVLDVVWVMTNVLYGFRISPFWFIFFLGGTVVLFSFLDDGFDEHLYIFFWHSHCSAQSQCWSHKPIISHH